MRRVTAVLFVVALLVAVVAFAFCESPHSPEPPVPPSTTTSSSTTTTTTPVKRHHHKRKPTLAETLRWLYALDYHHWADWPLWHALGRCEQGGYAPEGDGIAWHGQPIGGSASSDYPGGLGIMAQAWIENRDASMPMNGAYATPAQQIIVARRIRNRFGLSAWSCGQKLFPGVH